MLKQGLCKLTSFTPRKIKITGLKLKSPGKGYAPPLYRSRKGTLPSFTPPLYTPLPRGFNDKPLGSKFHFFIKSLILNPEGFLKLVSIYLYNEIRENR